jgi:hypothetical protein
MGFWCWGGREKKRPHGTQKTRRNSLSKRTGNGCSAKRDQLAALPELKGKTLACWCVYLFRYYFCSLVKPVTPMYSRNWPVRTIKDSCA